MSTIAKSEETERRRKERERLKRHTQSINKRKNNPDYRILTQEELIEEARETEKLNLKSLGLLFHASC